MSKLSFLKSSQNLTPNTHREIGIKIMSNHYVLPSRSSERSTLLLYGRLDGWIYGSMCGLRYLTSFDFLIFSSKITSEVCWVHKWALKLLAYFRKKVRSILIFNIRKFKTHTPRENSTKHFWRKKRINPAETTCNFQKICYQKTMILATKTLKILKVIKWHQKASCSL